MSISTFIEIHTATNPIRSYKAIKIEPLPMPTKKEKILKISSIETKMMETGEEKIRVTIYIARHWKWNGSIIINRMNANR